MYDDMWVGGKGMYKLEPIVEDGGELIVYAPHIDEISYTHGKIIEEVGYHVRDYFLSQWSKFKHYPWSVLAHSTHVKGLGTYNSETGQENPRITVTLATKIPESLCHKINLGYRDPDSIDLDEWEQTADPDVLVVRNAGEQLYRID
jgi:nickel-dependent lactate racemase